MKQRHYTVQLSRNNVFLKNDGVREFITNTFFFKDAVSLLLSLDPVESYFPDPSDARREEIRRVLSRAEEIGACAIADHYDGPDEEEKDDRDKDNVYDGEEEEDEDEDDDEDEDTVYEEIQYGTGDPEELLDNDDDIYDEADAVLVDSSEVRRSAEEKRDSELGEFRCGGDVSQLVFFSFTLFFLFFFFFFFFLFLFFFFFKNFYFPT